MKIRFPTLLTVCCALVWSGWAAAQPTPDSVIQVSDHDACLRSPAEPVEVQFSTNSMASTDWWWDFGNGQNSSLPNPVVEYNTPSSYTVTLTVESVRWGSISTVEENLIQINQLVFEDDFELPSVSNQNWDNFDLDLIVDSALEFDIKAKPHTLGEQNGDIICLNGDGRVPPEPVSNARFFFDLELIAEHSQPAEYTALQLLGGSSSQAIAGLRVRRGRQGFSIRIQSPGSVASWHSLVQPNPVLTVGLDWYRDDGDGGLTLEIQEASQPAMIQHLSTTHQPDFQTVQLGVINLVRHNDGASAGKMRVDNFRTCKFDHRPDS